MSDPEGMGGDINEQGNSVYGKTVWEEDSYPLQEMWQERLSHKKENLRVVRIWWLPEDQEIQLGQDKMTNRCADA